MLEDDSGGGTDPAVRRSEVRPGCLRGGWVLLAVEFLEGLARDDFGGRARRLVFDGVGRLLADVRHAVKTRLYLATTDGEIHRAILRVNQDIGDG